MINKWYTKYLQGRHEAVLINAEVCRRSRRLVASINNLNVWRRHWRCRRQLNRLCRRHRAVRRDTVGESAAERRDTMGDGIISDTVAGDHSIMVLF